MSINSINFINSINVVMNIASKSAKKLQAFMRAFPEWIDVVTHQCHSRVSTQPFGREEIRRGALNRVRAVAKFPTIALETGLIVVNGLPHDITCCVLRTRLGTFEAWSETFGVPRVFLPKWEQWLSLKDRHQVTLGSLIDPENSADWYGSDDRAAYRKSRVEYMSDTVCTS